MRSTAIPVYILCMGSHCHTSLYTKDNIMINSWLALPQDHRKTMLQQAASIHQLSPKAIEHDWWTTLALRAIFITPYAPYCIFKGGSSLSKAWNMLQRFSEDIDIALMPEAFGMVYKPNPGRSYVSWLKRSGRGFICTAMKAALIKAFGQLGVPPSAITIQLEGSRRKDPTIVLIRYRSILMPRSHTDQAVRLEFTVRNLRDPFTEMPLRSILSETFDDVIYKEEPFSARVVAPHKTLIEKLFLLHEKFSGRRQVAFNESGRSLHWQSRHLYDAVRLMNTKAGVEALRDTALYAALVQHRRHYARLNNVDYNMLTHARLNFVPSIEWWQFLRQDYASVCRSLIYGEAPAFDELLKQLALYNQKMRLVDTGIPIEEIIEDFLQSSSR